MEKLSVIVPVYNAEKYIDKCINSILNQTYKNIELLLINDGSKDNSLSICNVYAEKDERVKVFDKQNGGAASARNLGIKNATGYYIGFCDADDFFELDAFETLINIMEENDLPTIECLANVYSQDLTLLDKSEDNRTLTTLGDEQAIRDIFLRKGNVSLAVRVTKAEFIKDLIIPEGKRVEDFYFTILLLTKTKGTATYNYPFYNCVTSDGSVTRSVGGAIYVDALYFYEKAVSYLKDFDYDLKDAQEYYLLKMYYLLAISLTRKERKIFKGQIKLYKNYLRSNKREIKSQNHLMKKEKITLKIASISFRFARILYLMKNII